MSRAANLSKLQQIDSQLDHHQKRLAKLSELLGADEIVQQTKTKLEAAETATAESRQAYQLIQDEIDTMERKRQTSDERLYGGSINAPKELRDLQEEVAALGRRLGVLEDRQLDAMITHEEAEQVEASTRSECARIKSDWDGEQHTLAAEKVERENEATRLEAEREAALIPINPADRQAYTQLRQSKRGVAAVQLQDGVCTACGIAPPSARIQKARTGAELVRCGNCGRILYVS